MHSLKGKVMILISCFDLFFCAKIVTVVYIDLLYLMIVIFFQFWAHTYDNESFALVNLQNCAFCAILTQKFNFFQQKSLKTSTNA
jgi:hypothetical protein